MSERNDGPHEAKGVLLERAIRLHRKKLAGDDDEALDKSSTLPPLANQSELMERPARRPSLGEQALLWLGIRRADLRQDRTNRS